MIDHPSNQFRYLIHGLGVELRCASELLLQPLRLMWDEFTVENFSGGTTPISGVIRLFDQAEVLRRLPPTASRLVCKNDLLELYEQDERFWVVDDHWGLCELDMLKGQWRSWILPDATMDQRQVIEQAVIWPIAQLLKSRGLCLLPAASVVRDGFAALLISGFNIELELTALVRSGYRLVGQNWTALKDSDGRLELLTMPGYVLRASPDRMDERPVDLTAEYCGSRCHRARCSAVMLIAAGRRPHAELSPVLPQAAMGAIRRAWPIADLHPFRRQGRLPVRLAQHCRVFDVRLSRRAEDILPLMDKARRYWPVAAPAVSVRVRTPWEALV